MSSFYRLASSWLQQSRQMGTDSLQLVRHLLKSPSDSSKRTVLLQHARQANSAAISYLKLEREVGLLQYHGVYGYVRRQAYATGTTTTEQQPTASPQTTTQAAAPPAARVAFMITAIQRQSLQQDLGYTQQDIKQLKPAEAAWILEHRLTPEQFLLNPPQSPTKVLATVSQSTAVTSTSTSTTHSSIKTRKWYEVVEETTEGTMQVIGLYSKQEEANMLQQTKQELAQKYLTEIPTYVVRETDR